MENWEIPLTIGMKLKDPDGRQYEIRQIVSAQSLVLVTRLDKRKGEHLNIWKGYHPVKWNWERLP